MPLTGIDASLQTSATLSADQASEYIYDELLERPEKLTVFWGLAEKNTLPLHNGKTAQWNRYERLGLPGGPLEDGVTPPGQSLAISTVQAVVEQWGAWVGLSDMAQLTVKHPALQETKSLLNLQHKETLDREAQLPLLGASSVYYANGKTSRANLTASDVPTSDDIRRMVASLRQAGARYYRNRYYVGVHDPYVEGDFSKDATFVTGAAESQVERLNDFVTSTWMGGEWMRSNMIPIVSLMTANWATQAADTTAIAGATLFTGTSGTVLTKTTYLDPETRIETVIEAESSSTNAANFSVIVTISGANAPTGIYYVYATLENGATGTATRQVRINHTAGADSVVKLVKAGAPTPTDTFVVTGTGAVAPPTPPSGVNIHTTYLLGKGAFGVVTLAGLETTMTQPKQATDSDPLAQRTKCGWKQPVKGVVLNPSFFKRMESASAFN